MLLCVEVILREASYYVVFARICVNYVPSDDSDE